MRVAEVALAAVALLALPPCAVAQPAAPRLDFSAPDLNGEPYDTGTLVGEPVLVDFWAVWCAPCIAAFPLLNELHDARGAQGVRVIGVALHSGSPGEVAAFLAEHETRYPVLVGDEELAERFGIVGFPSYLLFGPDGRLVQTYVGKLEGFRDELRAALVALRASPQTRGGAR